MKKEDLQGSQDMSWTFFTSPHSILCLSKYKPSSLASFSCKLYRSFSVGVFSHWQFTRQTLLSSTGEIDSLSRRWQVHLRSLYRDRPVRAPLSSVGRSEKNGPPVRLHPIRSSRRMEYRVAIHLNFTDRVRSDVGGCRRTCPC